MAEDSRELRRRVARDAGIAVAVADTWIGENQATVVAEAFAHAERTRGEQGVRAVHQHLAEADLRESPDDLRARVARDLQLTLELREKLSSSTTTEAQVVDDALSLLRQSGGTAALDAGVRRLQGKAMDSWLRESVRPQRAVVVDTDDMNEVIRGLSGRTPDAA